MQKIILASFLFALAVQLATCYKATTLSPQQTTTTKIEVQKQNYDMEEIQDEDDINQGLVVNVNQEDNDDEEDADLVKSRPKRGWRIRRRRRSHNPCPVNCARFNRCIKYTGDYWRCIKHYPLGNCLC